MGLTTLDYIYYVDSYPENNSKVKTNTYKRYVGGPAANAAITYALLGGNATLITCLGSSNEAALIENILSEYGVQVINCASDSSMPCMATISVDGAGNRTIFSGQSIYKELNLPEKIEAKFCLFDLNRQEISLEILSKIDCKIVLDAGSFKGETDKFLQKADIIISSEGFKNPDGYNIFEIPYIEEKLLAMTRGNEAIIYTEKETGSPFAPKSLPVEKVECVDSLAAGDIFHGAFCFAYFEAEKNFEESLKYASKIATESVKYEGPRAWSKH